MRAGSGDAFFQWSPRNEIAEALGVAEITVKRDWKFARAWLLAELKRCPRRPTR